MFVFGEALLLKVPESLTHPDHPTTGEDSRLQHGALCARKITCP